MQELKAKSIIQAFVKGFLFTLDAIGFDAVRQPAVPPKINLAGSNLTDLQRVGQDFEKVLGKIDMSQQLEIKKE